jgi:SAM-dependent methyltransferase
MGSAVLDAIAPLLERQFGKIDLDRAGIEFHCPVDRIEQLPAGLLGLVLGELLGNRYKYTREQPVYPDEIDVGVARRELEEADRVHPGPEGGGRRAYADGLLAARIPEGADLLDFGCGGPAHKSYYARCRAVTGVDINPHALMYMRAFHPDRATYRFIWAPLGATELETASTECILASAVLGYLPPSMSNLIVDEMVRLLWPGGRLVIGHTAAFGVAEWLSGRGRLIERPDEPGSFHYKFTLPELCAVVRAKGLTVRKALRYVLKLPRTLRKRTNAVYLRPAVQSLDRVVNTVPGFATWHLVVAEKLQ